MILNRVYILLRGQTMLHLTMK